MSRRTLGGCRDKKTRMGWCRRCSGGWMVVLGVHELHWSLGLLMDLHMGQ
jgi:hypothetical protein